MLKAGDFKLARVGDDIAESPKRSTKARSELSTLLAVPAVALITGAILESMRLGQNIGNFLLYLSAIWSAGLLLPFRISQRFLKRSATNSTVVDELPAWTIYKKALESAREAESQPLVHEVLSLAARLEAHYRLTSGKSSRWHGGSLLTYYWSEAKREKAREKASRMVPSSGQRHIVLKVHSLLGCSRLPAMQRLAIYDASLAMIHCEALTVNEFETLYSPFWAVIRHTL